MIAARCTPFGRAPLRSAVLICSSVHEPMPVSLSCVMFDAVTLNGGSSQESPLERSRSKIGAPRSPFGVWQFWQVMIVLTRYLPRSTDGCAGCASANVAPATVSTTAVDKTRKIMKVLPEPRLPADIVLTRRAGDKPENKKGGQRPPFLFQLVNAGSKIRPRQAPRPSPAPVR